MKSFVANNVGQMSNWQFKIKDVTTQLDDLWLVARYTLGQSCFITPIRLCD
jgi:hypothetical protein